MTEQVQEVKAGRELDALVAATMEPIPVVVPVGVLRGQAEARREDWRYSWYTFDSPSGWWRAQIGTDGGEHGDLCEWVPAKEPSVEFDAAMEVVEKLKADDFWPLMTWKAGVFIDDWHRAVWLVRFRCVRAGTRGDHWAADESLPLAICLAALKAVEQAREPRKKRCNFPWCGVEKLCVDCAQTEDAR